jgi:hypothetical protein
MDSAVELDCGTSCWIEGGGCWRWRPPTVCKEGQQYRLVEP